MCVTRREVAEPNIPDAVAKVILEKVVVKLVGRRLLLRFDERQEVALWKLRNSQTAFSSAAAIDRRENRVGKRPNIALASISVVDRWA
jgi:hypothetical protein